MSDNVASELPTESKAPEYVALLASKIESSPINRAPRSEAKIAAIAVSFQMFFLS